MKIDTRAVGAYPVLFDALLSSVNLVMFGTHAENVSLSSCATLRALASLQRSDTQKRLASQTEFAPQATRYAPPVSGSLKNCARPARMLPITSSAKA